MEGLFRTIRAIKVYKRFTQRGFNKGVLLAPRQLVEIKFEGTTRLHRGYILEGRYKGWFTGRYTLNGVGATFAEVSPLEYLAREGERESPL